MNIDAWLSKLTPITYALYKLEARRENGVVIPINYRNIAARRARLWEYISVVLISSVVTRIIAQFFMSEITLRVTLIFVASLCFACGSYHVYDIAGEVSSMARSDEARNYESYKEFVKDTEETYKRKIALAIIACLAGLIILGLSSFL